VGEVGGLQAGLVEGVSHGGADPRDQLGRPAGGVAGVSTDQPVPEDVGDRDADPLPTQVDRSDRAGRRVDLEERCGPTGTGIRARAGPDQARRLELPESR
jgi:hypothetical protein